MRPVVTYVAWSVCLSVGLYVTIVNPAKTDKLIETLFEILCEVGPKKHVLVGGPGPTCAMEISSGGRSNPSELIEMPFGVWTLVGPRKHGATWRIRLNRPCAAAMRPFCQITLTTRYVLVLHFGDSTSCMNLHQ